MLGNPDWYSEPNDSRESWYFLILDIEDDKIQEWHIGTGNAHQFLGSNSLGLESVEEEVDLLTELMELVDQARRDRATLVTFDADTVARLRTRLIEIELSSNSFRGLSHVALQDVLGEYFEDSDKILEVCRNLQDETMIPMSEVMTDERTPYSLWNIFTTIGSLVPKEEIKGVDL